MTGRVHFTPEAQAQLNRLDEWLAEQSSEHSAQEFVLAIMAHCERILLFPHAGRPRDDIRPGLRTTSFRKRTLIVYEDDRSPGSDAVTIVGVFHGGQDWETALSSKPDIPRDEPTA